MLTLWVRGLRPLYGDWDPRDECAPVDEAVDEAEQVLQIYRYIHTYMYIYIYIYIPPSPPVCCLRHLLRQSAERVILDAHAQRRAKRAR